MSISRQDLQTRGYWRMLNVEALQDSGPCRLMAVSYAGGTAAWEGVHVVESTEVDGTDILFKVGPSQSGYWSFGPNGIYFSTLSAAQTGAAQAVGVGSVFLILE